MAKIKAPLFGLSASGQIGKALVYFPWKGLNVAREHVVPSNPQTTAQTTQRGYVTSAVTDIHEAQAHATDPLGEDDKSAYALWASVVKAATTWFNQAVKNWVDVTIAGNTPTVYRKGGVTPGANQIDCSVRSDEINGADITAGKFYYGTSKTALINSSAAVINAGANMASKVIGGLTTGVKYYVQFRPDVGENCEGANSGIYYGTPT